jgi:hypothetical protein
VNKAAAQTMLAGEGCLVSVHCQTAMSRHMTCAINKVITLILLTKKQQDWWNRLVRDGQEAFKSLLRR